MKRDPEKILKERRKTWKSKSVIRDLYGKWYGSIAGALKPGATLELGGGSGNLKDFFPDTISSDVLYAPWLDAVLDAHTLPFQNESLDGIVLFDVLHHLSRPILFFSEAQRVLKPGGRIVMMEPYVSWFSYPVYRFFHQEGLQWKMDPFHRGSPEGKKDPFAGNQAIPTIMFEKCKQTFDACFPGFSIVQREVTDFLVYPLSGGFHHPALFPLFMWPALKFLEGFLVLWGDSWLSACLLSLKRMRNVKNRVLHKGPVNRIMMKQLLVGAATFSPRLYERISRGRGGQILRGIATLSG